MKKFFLKNTELRIEILNYITDYLKKANRNIVVPHNVLSYLCWDYSQNSPEAEYSSLVPEIEITMIGLTDNGEVYFIDATGEEVHQGNLDTEELIYVADFLDELETHAPGSDADEQ